MAEDTQKSAPDARPRKRRFGWWMLFTNLLLLLALIYAALALSGRAVPLPGWMAEQASARISSSVAPARVRLGSLALTVGRDGVPGALMRDITILDGSGSNVAHLNEMTADVAPRALVGGVIAPTMIELRGAQLTVRRGVDGDFTLAFGTGDGVARGSSAEVVQAVSGALDIPALSYLGQVTADNITLALEDARSGRIWQAVDAGLTVDISDERITAAVLTDVFNGTEDLATVQMGVTADRSDGALGLGASLTQMPARDVAQQAPALSFLGVIDANIDGSVRASLDDEGQLTSIAAALEIGQGAIRPQADTSFSFDRARAYLDFDPERQRIAFSQVSMTSDRLSVIGDGHAYLRDLENGWPQRMEGHLSIENLEVDGTGILAADRVSARGKADLNLTLDPFGVEIGQFMLEPESGGRVHMSGHVRAAPQGWRVALDLASPELRPEEVLAFWPLDAIAGARRWVAKNVLDGTIRDVVGGVRIAPGTPPDVAVGFEIEDATVRFLDDLPPITGGYGRSTYANHAYTIVLSKGQVVSRSGGAIDLAGSVFQIADVRPDLRQADITLVTEGPLEAALTILDNEPFSILQKSGLPADAAEAMSRGRTEISLPLKRNLRLDDLVFSTSGTLQDVVSTDLIPDRPLAAETLSVEVDRDGLTVAGQGMVDEIPIEARWRQSFDPVPGQGSRLDADVSLDPETLARLGVDPVAIGAGGEAQARLVLQLPAVDAGGGAGSFELTSDLRGLSLSLSDIGWSKPAPAGGELRVSGVLDPELEISEFEFESPGLAALGRPQLREDGSLAALDLSALTIGDWFDGQALLRMSGRGAPDVTILGGRLDLRNRPGPSPTGPARGMDVALDALVVSDTLTLRPFSARLPEPGRTGRFDSRVNGGTLIEGDLIPQRNGLAIRLRSANGGGVLTDAGILKGASGGQLEALIVPGQIPGSLDAQATINNLVLRGAPVAARVLDQVSVIGLLDELNGPGIWFEEMTARFWLGQDELRLYSASAVGPSLGVSLDGTYDTREKTLDMQGVISPFYLINQVGSVLTRRGEGLIGIGFLLDGDAQSPQIVVNPLSIFTPGALREIFRTAPPSRPETGE